MIPCILVVGTRPNFVKVAPVLRAMDKFGGFQPLLIHTGQHYDEQMSRSFFDVLGIRKPDMNLDVGGGNHADVLAAIMRKFDHVLDIYSMSRFVMVFGDVNSTLAVSLVAAYRHYPIVHVEAGLRSGDMAMPEEVNRTLVDRISSVLYVSEHRGMQNPALEACKGVPLLVGNVMADSLIHTHEAARTRQGWSDLGLGQGEYALVTLHRPSNVDDKESLGRCLEWLNIVALTCPTLFVVHPRTAGRIKEHFPGLALHQNVRLLPPQDYITFQSLIMGARVVLTDSGGIQEETSMMRVPCITVRENTERPVTLSYGSNLLLSTEPEQIVQRFHEALELPSARDGLDLGPHIGQSSRLWDGHASKRIVQDLLVRFS